MKEWIKRHFFEGYFGGKAKKSTPTFDIDMWIPENQAYARSLKALAVKMIMGVLILVVIMGYALGFSLMSEWVKQAAIMNPVDMINAYNDYSNSMSGMSSVSYVGVGLLFALYFSVAHLNKLKHEETSWVRFKLFTSQGFQRNFDIDMMELEPIPIPLSKKRLDEKKKEAKKGLTEEEKKKVDEEFEPFYDKDNPLSLFAWYRKDDKFRIFLVARVANLAEIEPARSERHSLGFGSKKLPFREYSVVDRSPYIEPYEDMSRVIHYCAQCGEEIPEEDVNEEGKAICKMKDCNKTGCLRQTREAHPIETEVSPLLYIMNMPCGAPHWIPTVAQDGILHSLMKEPSLVKAVLELNEERMGKTEAIESLRKKDLKDTADGFARLPKLAPMGKTEQENKDKEETKKHFDKLKFAVATLGAWAIVATILGILL